MAETLVILGASVRAAAASAVRAGLAPFGVDLFADRDLRRMCPCVRVDPAEYPAGLFAAADAAPPGPWMYTGGLENHPDLIDGLAGRRPLWGNPGSVLRRVRDPFELHRVLSAAGFATPEVRPDPAGLPTDGSWLVKPLRGSGGRGVAEWRGQNVAALGPVVYQRFVAGRSFAGVFCADGRGGCVPVGVTRQLLPGDGPAWAPGRFQYCGSFVPARLEPVRARLALRKVGALLAAEFGLVGLFGVDVVAAGGTVHVIEVNPRYTASVEVLESASDFRGLEAHRAACVEGQLPRPATEEHAAGKLVVFARQPFTVPAEGDWPPAEETILPETADVPPPGTAVAAGDPVLTLLHRAEDYHQMSRRLAFGARAMERLIARLVPPPPQEPRPE